MNNKLAAGYLRLNSQQIWSLGVILILLGIAFFPSHAFPLDLSGGGFESRLDNLQGKFISVILPLMSILGLVYAAILAACGNEGAKGKILIIIVGSIIGFLAPHIIGWIKGVLN